MRKFLLFGTMLGVATTALAFGGVFSHGSKSTTYKGGVNAIGVHFGGEKKTADSTDTVPPCPEERQCGDTCCGEGHTCQEGQCCDENGHCCNSSGYSTIYEVCCDEDSAVYKNRDGYTECCPNTYTLTYFEEGWSYCCEDGIAYQDAIEDTFCCPVGSKIFALGASHWGSVYHSVCCEAGKVGYCNERPEEDSCDSEICCDSGGCCAPDKIVYGAGENGADICEE